MNKILMARIGSGELVHLVGGAILPAVNDGGVPLPILFSVVSRNFSAATAPAAAL
jgi:hypothetical protein